MIGMLERGREMKVGLTQRGRLRGVGSDGAGTAYLRPRKALDDAQM